MKKALLFILGTSVFNFVEAQSVRLPDGGGEYVMSTEHTECVTQAQREQMIQEISYNKAMLQAQGKLNFNEITANPTVHPLFSWPVTKSASAPYNNVWSISNHVDHNASYPNAIQDWNCGTRTYDTSGGYNHKGIDIFTWPFTWYQMDNDQALAVAAAPGIIVYKLDGNFDRSCSFNSNNWNVVCLMHADGSQSWYGHLKNGSQTTKNVGDSVITGEYIGVVGSSGNSTGPHLHFEVYNSANELVDTYLGPCNTWSSSTDSWWQTQKPYWEPKINAALTHSAFPQFNTCPTTETHNMQDNFNVGTNVVVAIYLADQLAGSSVNLTLRRPDNSIQANWNFNLVDQYYASYWYWTFPASQMTQQGTYQFSATYQGSTVTHNFNYGTLGVAQNEMLQFLVAPNPAQETLTVQANNPITPERITFYDVMGKKVLEYNSPPPTFTIAALTKGVYFAKITSEGAVYTVKIVKE